MPLILPKQKGVRREANFSGQPSTTWGTALTSDGTAHVEPATETELIASTAFDTDWVNIWFHTNSASNTDSDSLVNIKTGAGGSEVTLLPNLLAGWVGTPAQGFGQRHYGFPLFIPTGTRLSATHRSVGTSTTVRCMIELLGGGRSQHWTGTGVETIGADTATSSGTYVTPGGASEGTLTSMGTTAREWGFVQPMLAGNTNTTMNLGVLSIDLASDGSTVIDGLDEFLFESNSAEISFPWNQGGRYCYVPTGTTLNLRAQTSASPEAMAFAVYGVF